MSPELLWDTFVTIGETVAQGAGDLPNTFDAPSFGKTPGFAEQVDELARCFTLDDTGWLVTGFPAHSQAVDGRVLLAQLTVFNTAGPYGYDWQISYVENGVPNSGDLSFGVIGAACGCVTDLNGDGGTGFADLSRLLTAWGECGLCPEDLDADGAVGFADLSEMLKWVGSLRLSDAIRRAPRPGQARAATSIPACISRHSARFVRVHLTPPCRSGPSGRTGRGALVKTAPAATGFPRGRKFSSQYRSPSNS